MAYRILSASLGILLLAAAGLKFYGFAVSPVPQLGHFSSPSFQVSIIAWECLLGTWLISGAARTGAWLLACGTFTAF